MELEQLYAEERQLLTSIANNRHQQKELRTKIWLDSLGIKFGDLLEITDRDKIVVGELVKLEYYGTEPNHLIIRLLNTDGKVGKRERRIWGYEMKTLKLHKPNETTN